MKGPVNCVFHCRTRDLDVLMGRWCREGMRYSPCLCCCRAAASVRARASERGSPEGPRRPAEDPDTSCHLPTGQAADPH